MAPCNQFDIVTPWLLVLLCLWWPSLLFFVALHLLRGCLLLTQVLTEGYTTVVVFLVLNYAFVGIATSAVVKYLDNMTKTFAANAAMFLVALISIVFYNEQPTMQLFVGMFVAAVAVETYNRQNAVIAAGKQSDAPGLWVSYVSHWMKFLRSCCIVSASCDLPPCMWRLCQSIYSGQVECVWFKFVYVYVYAYTYKQILPQRSCVLRFMNNMLLCMCLSQVETNFVIWGQGQCVNAIVMTRVVTLLEWATRCKLVLPRIGYQAEDSRRFLGSVFTTEASLLMLQQGAQWSD